MTAAQDRCETHTSVTTDKCGCDVPPAPSPANERPIQRLIDNDVKRRATPSAASTYDHPATATAAREEVVRVEKWTTESVPVEAYDLLLDFTKRCERLLTEIRDGKHSLPGTLVQIDRLLKEGHSEFRRPL